MHALMFQTGLPAALCGLGAYLLIASPHRQPWFWLMPAGWTLLLIGGSLFASELLRPVGSFVSLLAFTLIAAATTAAAIAAAALQDRVKRAMSLAVCTALCGVWVVLIQSNAVNWIVALALWLAGMIACRSRSRLASNHPSGERRPTSEPALACVVWSLLLAAASSAFASQESARNASNAPDVSLAAAHRTAAAANHMLAGSALVATGILSFVARRDAASVVFGSAIAHLGLLVISLAAGSRPESGHAFVWPVVLLCALVVSATALRRWSPGDSESDVASPAVAGGAR